MKILVTGGAGFIGSAVCRHLINDTDHLVINVDKLTYAANLSSLSEIEDSDRYLFVKADICDQELLFELMQREDVDAVMNLAAESHVDRSIDGPAVFLQTNIIGTCHLLEAARRHWLAMPENRKDGFRFHHISTDEVFGDLPLSGGLFTEQTRYQPSSPYSASKASSDHLVMAWHKTYGLPVVLSNCSNNYGPFHFPEKLIPLAILNALEERLLPVFGDGRNIRDWLYVDDHARALIMIVSNGQAGESYNVGGGNERTNLQVVKTICGLMDDLRPLASGRRHTDLIAFAPDRPGHDLRYAIDATKIETELGWKALETFETGLEKTVKWFLERKDWWQPIREKRYGGERLGRAGRAGF